MFRYVHTNIIAKDADRLIEFYRKVLHCRSIGEVRDIRGQWLDKMTGISHAHITGEHLLLPGYENDHPTIEIFSYDKLKDSIDSAINRPGIAHLAFEVDDVRQTLREIIANGGSALGEVVTANYPDNLEATFVYAKDPEGNILELQSWRNK